MGLGKYVQNSYNVRQRYMLNHYSIRCIYYMCIYKFLFYIYGTSSDNSFVTYTEEWVATLIGFFSSCSQYFWQMRRWTSVLTQPMKVKSSIFSTFANFDFGIAANPFRKIFCVFNFEAGFI